MYRCFTPGKSKNQMALSKRARNTNRPYVSGKRKMRECTGIVCIIDLKNINSRKAVDGVRSASGFYHVFFFCFFLHLLASTQAFIVNSILSNSLKQTNCLPLLNLLSCKQ